MARPMITLLLPCCRSAFKVFIDSMCLSFSLRRLSSLCIVSESSVMVCASDALLLIRADNSPLYRNVRIDGCSFMWGTCAYQSVVLFLEHNNGFIVGFLCHSIVTPLQILYCRYGHRLVVTNTYIYV